MARGVSLTVEKHLWVVWPIAMHGLPGEDLADAVLYVFLFFGWSQFKKSCNIVAILFKPTLQYCRSNYSIGHQILNILFSVH